MWNAFSEFMKSNVAPHLKALLTPLDQLIDTLPLWVGTACAIGLFVIVGIWALTLKRSYIYLGAPDQAAWRDLRIWTIIVLLPYIIVYLIF